MKQRSDEHARSDTDALPGHYRGSRHTKNSPPPVRPLPGQRQRITVAFLLGRPIESADLAFACYYAAFLKRQLITTGMSFTAQLLGVGIGLAVYWQSLPLPVLLLAAFMVIAAATTVGMVTAYRAQTWLRHRRVCGLTECFDDKDRFNTSA